MLLPEQPANGHCVLKSRLLIQRQRQICAVKELVKQRNRIIRNGGDYALEHHNFALSVRHCHSIQQNVTCQIYYRHQMFNRVTTTQSGIYSIFSLTSSRIKRFITLRATFFSRRDNSSTFRRCVIKGIQTGRIVFSFGG